MTNVDEVSSDEFDIRDFDSDDLDAIPDDAIHDKSQGPLTIDDVLDHRTDSEDGDNDETDHVAASILASMQPLQRMPARPCQNPEPEAKRRKTTTEGAPRLKTRSAESDWTRLGRNPSYQKATMCGYVQLACYSSTTVFQPWSKIRALSTSGLHNCVSCLPSHETIASRRRGPNVQIVSERSFVCPLSNHPPNARRRL